MKWKLHFYVYFLLNQNHTHENMSDGKCKRILRMRKVLHGQPAAEIRFLLRFVWKNRDVCLNVAFVCLTERKNCADEIASFCSWLYHFQLSSFAPFVCLCMEGFLLLRWLFDENRLNIYEVFSLHLVDILVRWMFHCLVFQCFFSEYQQNMSPFISCVDVGNCLW